MRVRILFAVAVLIGVSSSSWAQGRDLVTALSRDVAAVGEAIPLIYRFVNTPEPGMMPQTISVDGLEITFQNAQKQSSMNFSFGSGGVRDLSETAIEYVYIVRPQRSGLFTIPGFEVAVGNRMMKTKPAKLRVVDSGGRVPRAAPVPPPVPQSPVDALQQFMNQMMGGGAPQIPQIPGFPLPIPQPGGAVPPASAGDGRDFFGEMNIGAKSSYVGEVVPVDLRFYFRADMVRQGWQPDRQRLRLSGEGFTVAPLSEPNQTTREIDGTPYRVFTFRTAIIPAKTGDLEIPPAILGITVTTARGLFGQMPEEVEVPTGQGAKLRVEPLPQDGQPISFSEAIGQFDLSASVDPQSAEAGEPLTYRLTVRGRGNFDSMRPPELNSTTGWRTYPPKEKFEPDEGTGFGGSKTFEYKIVARHDQTTTPGADFSYFDPDKKEYVTLKADPLPVEAKGRASSASEPPAGDESKGPGASQDSSEASENAAAGIAAAADALSSKSASTFAPILRNQWFWWINLSLAVAFLVALPLVLWLRRRAARNALANELEWALKQARSALGKASDRVEFYNAAAHLVQARLAAGDGKKARFIDTGEALRRQVQDPVLRREIENVLGRRDEMKYGGHAAGALDPAEKNRVVAVLDKFAKNHD